MPAKTGQQYIASLRDNPAEVWIRGEQIKDVTTHPALRGGVKSVAALYDRQLDAEVREEMVFPSPSSGDPVGLSFLVPRTIEDLLLRRKMMTHWARVGCGMMARTPDFMNVSIAGWFGAAEYFGRNRPEFADNVRRYFEFIRENDITLTHTLVNLQPRRKSGVLDQLDDQVALTVVKETDAGIVVRGSRVLATLGPIAGEIAVYPTRTHMMGPESWRQAFSFAIPNSTPGVKFICRESFDYGRSNFDHPLGSRFEEMDSIVFFDDVLVPWERVFLLGDVDMCNNYGIATQSTTHSGYQVINRCVVKTEFILGLAQLMADTLGSGELQHIQERIAEIIIHLETLKACMRASEADAALNDFGVMCPAQGPITVRASAVSHDHLPAAGRNRAAPGLRQPHGPAVGGRLRRCHRPGGGALPEHRHRRRPRPGAAVPAGVGRGVQRLRRPAGALRTLLRRRPDPQRPDALPHLQP